MRGKGQAKNVGKFFWEEKFHAANVKAQGHTECALHFFFLSLGAGDLEENIFQVSLVPLCWPSPPSTHFDCALKGKGGM